MKLCTDKPLNSYFESIGKRSVDTLVIASPFVTNSGVGVIQSWIKTRRNTRVQLLTNLSEFNLLLSLNDPIAPIQRLKKILGERLEIKSLSNLHAKLFLADNKVALSGSSNLTQGGAITNRELNWLVSNKTKMGQGQIVELQSWFNDVWTVSTEYCSEDLTRLENLWKENSKKLHAHFGGLLPEPDLAGNQWRKVQEITSAASGKENVLAILRRQDKDKGVTPDYDQKSTPHNVHGKLTFLLNAGLVKIDGEKVVPLKSLQGPKELVPILCDHLPGFKDVLKAFQGKNEFTYSTLADFLSGQVLDSNMKSSVKWLEDLEKVKRDKSQGEHIFRANKKLLSLKL